MLSILVQHHNSYNNQLCNADLLSSFYQNRFDPINDQATKSYNMYKTVFCHKIKLYNVILSTIEIKNKILFKYNAIDQKSFFY